jgi:lipopolysaccharide biosynthesis protein
MNSSDNQSNNKVFVSFDWLWKYFPIQRSTKEAMKRFLFGSFPFLFKRWVIYQNWKNALIYRDVRQSVFKKAYWARRFCRRYPIPIAKNNPDVSTQKIDRLAVVVHVYYIKIFREIMEALEQPVDVKLELYITSPACSKKEVLSLIPESIDFKEYLIVENRGRDILPFLKILPRVIADGHKLVLKLHTKGSNHLNRKEHWRNDLFSKLIGSGVVNRMVNNFNLNPNIGIIGPSGNILSMQYYYGSNAQIVHELSEKIGVNETQLQGVNFVAGSMFYARSEIFEPLLRIGLRDDDFEAEAGQKDGTLAHAVERIFTVGMIAANLQLADTDYDDQNPGLMVDKNHYFTS